MFYNQSANIVNSLAFGESQKSAIERLGNIDLIQTYQYATISELPSVGQKFNNYVISNMAIKNYGDYIQATLYLVKQNKINDFIGINSTRRFSEIAVNGAQARELLYSENVVYGDEETSDTIALTNAGKTKYLNTFIQSETTYDYGQSAFVKTVDRNDLTINNLIMPLTRVGKGNSLVFSFNMDDNFSAGVNAVDTVIATVDKKVSAYVRYTDYLGEFKDIEIKVADIGYYFDGVNLIGADPYLLPQNKALGLDVTVPTVNKIIDYTLLNVNKGNKEIIGSSYQLNSKKKQRTLL